MLRRGVLAVCGIAGLLHVLRRLHHHPALPWQPHLRLAALSVRCWGLHTLPPPHVAHHIYYYYYYTLIQSSRLGGLQHILNNSSPTCPVLALSSPKLYQSNGSLPIISSRYSRVRYFLCHHFYFSIDPAYLAADTFQDISEGRSRHEHVHNI